MKATLRSDADAVEALMSHAMRALWCQDLADPLTEFSVAQLRLLRSLGSGSQTASSLGDDLGLSVSAITQMVNRLESSGLVARTDDTADRRIKHLSLTAQGTQLLADRRTRRVDQAERVLGRLTAEQRRNLIDALRRVVAVGEGRAGRESPYLVAELELRLPPVP